MVCVVVIVVFKLKFGEGDGKFYEVKLVIVCFYVEQILLQVLVYCMVIVDGGVVVMVLVEEQF